MEFGVVAGVVVIGFVHGVLPDHGWPIAATYGLDHSRTWFHGTVAGLILGIGHLFSSVVLVLAYFWFSRFAAFAEGPWLRYVAGTVLVLLGLYEYRHGGHGHDHHDHEDDTNHGHDHHGHEEDAHRSHGHRGRDRDHQDDPPGRCDSRDSGAVGEAEPTADDGAGVLARVRSRLPGGHRHLSPEDADRGLLGLGTAALVLGFAHEEPIQILALCAGTAYCLELMLVYSAAVIVAILVPTLLLIAGYERYEETVEAYTPYLPLLTAVVLVGMGLGFIAGVF